MCPDLMEVVPGDVVQHIASLYDRSHACEARSLLHAHRIAQEQCILCNDASHRYEHIPVGSRPQVADGAWLPH